jgi:mono/diheme cytochrome c family protein
MFLFKIKKLLQHKLLNRNPMKKLSIILVLAITAIISSCNGVKREPGSIYMPDMAYSRAYESYADHSNLTEKGINYTAMPVAGTMPRGATTNYYASRAVKNPIDSLSKTDNDEAERLYLINCGICHGKNLDGNGPLWKNGDGPYPSAPKNLIADPIVSVMPEGQMFYSVTYGKNLMGAYASQLSRKQRWMVMKYVKNKQLAAKAAK